MGANGSGKTLTAVWDLLPTLSAGQRVLSTCRLADWENPRPCDDPTCEWPGHPDHLAAHPGWVPFTDWRQFLTFHDGAVLLDEVGGVASSRETSSLPFQVAAELQKLRKRNVTLSTTSPAWARADKIIRETAQIVVRCKGFFPTTVPGRDVDSVWKRNRLVTARVYDANDMQEDTEHQRESKHVGLLDWYVVSRNPAIVAYDTYDPVVALGWANESGMCMTCGGRRRAPSCGCEPVVRERRPQAARGEDAADAH